MTFDLAYHKRQGRVWLVDIQISPAQMSSPSMELLRKSCMRLRLKSHDLFEHT